MGVVKETEEMSGGMLIPDSFMTFSDKKDDSNIFYRNASNNDILSPASSVGFMVLTICTFIYFSSTIYLTSGL